MIFIENKYSKWYNSIITNAQSRGVVDAYTEKHHIIPRALGGSNRTSNLVVLTAREHFICHWLLTKMVEHKKARYQMWNALSAMMYWHRSDSQRVKISSRKIARLKEQLSKEKSTKSSGAGNAFFGRKHTAETTEKMRLAHAARFREHSLASKEYAANEPLEMKTARYAKSSLSQKGVAKPKFTCEYCGKTVGGHANYSRAHGTNCAKYTTTRS